MVTSVEGERRQWERPIRGQRNTHGGLTRRCEDTRFFASVFQSGLRHGVLIQKDKQAAHSRLDYKHAFELD
jgi:hypothetical protein